ncbi:DUF2505 domain-containing protein [Mycolicibacterium thermoresistibile]
MPRSFDMATEYGATVEQVHQALRDEQYWLARLADSGADDATLDALTVDTDGGIDVETTQVLWADRLPGFVTQLHRGDLSVKREETWSPLRDGQATVEVKGAIVGAPASLTGTGTLLPADSGQTSRLEFTVTVEVRIPLLGGKLEGLVGNQLMELLIAEQRFTTNWIAARA